MADNEGGRLYALRNILDKQPVTITGAAMAGVNVGVAFNVLDVTAKQLGSLNTFLILLLGLFINNKTANKATLEEIDEGQAGR